MSEQERLRFRRFFDPQGWPAARRFQVMLGPPFCHPEVRRGVEAVVSHLDKFEILVGLANRLAPTLGEDREELDRNGFSHATRSKEYAALIEVLVCELYSTLDGVRRAIFGAHQNVRGVKNKSTKVLFQSAAEKKYGPEFPEEMRCALEVGYNNWFQSLRRLRSELTHGSTGSCTLNVETGLIDYFHEALGDQTSVMVVHDVAGYVTGLATQVTELVDAVFRHLYSRLEQQGRRVMCGLFNGRLYEREVTPEPQLSLASGKCLSKSWFETQPGLECPLRHQCAAYVR